MLRHVTAILIPTVTATLLALAPADAAERGKRLSSIERLAVELWPAAQRRGVSRRVFDAAFAGLTIDPKVVEQASNQAEFKMPLTEYLAKRVSDRRIANGRAMKSTYAGRLAAIEKRYGVDRDILLAIWGLESNYGERKGDHNVVRALATLAVTGRRSFGRSQLVAALRILQRGDIAPSQFMGSWAGAMGHTQFIPTTYNAYAVDWTGDGRRDIWNSISDALASTANYLARSGWRRGLSWGWQVKLPTAFTARGRRTLAQWQKLGVEPLNGAEMGPAGATATLLFPAGKSGPAFLVTRNFRAILAYNNATSYALAVGRLSDRIEGDTASLEASQTTDAASVEPELEPR